MCLVASLVTGAFAFTDASRNHPGWSVAVFLFGWAALPSALAAVLLRKPKRLVNAVAFGAVTSTGGLLVFGWLAFSPQPDPDTARHLAPFLWPGILMFAGGAVAVVAWLVETSRPGRSGSQAT